MKKIEQEFKKLGQEPAFPTPSKDMFDRFYQEKGISKRLYLAGILMQGILSSGRPFQMNELKLEVEKAYKVADELLKQE